MITDQSILEAALVGYERQREDIESKIAEIRQHLGSSSATPSTVTGKTGKRTMNEAARQRIALAQKKRWAEYKKTHGTTAKKAPAKKRVLSPEARKHIAEATRKRWIAYRAAKAASQKTGKRGRGSAKKAAAAEATAGAA